jgi:hypothetical protein
VATLKRKRGKNMVKFDLLDFGVYADDKHIADFDNEGMAIEFA